MPAPHGPTIRPLTARMLAQDAVAERLVALPYGTALLSPALPDWYEGNQVRVERAAAGWEPEAIFEDAQHRLEQAGLAHRRILVAVPALAEPLAVLADGAGWDVVSLVAMALPAGAALGPGPGVEAIGAEAYAAFRRRQLAAYPWAQAPGVVDQLLAADHREETRGDARRFGVRGADGELAGMATLHRFAGAGEIDNVEVLAEHRGTGLGKALVLGVAAAAREADCDPLFLVADAQDPVARGLYERLGFVVVDGQLELTLRPR